MVINIGALKDRNEGVVTKDIEAVVNVAHSNSCL
jgi:deoxyribose-phosphate aldolase